MRTVVLLFLVSFFGGESQGELDFEKANSLYNEGVYAAAIQAYENILNNGLHSAEVYYNLANCYYISNGISKLRSCMQDGTIGNGAPIGNCQRILIGF